MKNKIIIYVIVQFLLILCSIFVIPNVEGVLSIFTVLIVIVGNVLNLIFLYYFFSVFFFGITAV